MMLLTLRGTPLLYQGEEIGMTDVPIPADRARDIAGRDPERTPMQWDGGPGAAFTTGDPWLPVGADADRVNVAAQREDPASMLSLYRRLIWYRKSSPALLRGNYRSVGSVADGVFGYVREADGQRLLVALNFTDRPVAFGARELPASGRLELSTDPHRRLGELGLDPLRIGPDEGVVVRLA